VRANPRASSTGLVPRPRNPSPSAPSVNTIRLHPDCCSNRHWNLSTLLLHVQHPPIRQSANSSICQTVNPSICQTVKLSNCQFNLREECPYCDTRTLVGDNPARWFCSILLHSLVQVRRLGHIRAPAESVRKFPIQWNLTSRTQT
jgi:hypothetical protein